MQRILKYEIPLKDRFEINMPYGKSVVKVDVVNGKLYM